jgi:quinol monooxygenase YgiN
MSQPFTAIATLIAKPGQQDALEQHLRALVEPTRAEAGCGQYDLHQDLANPLAFYMIERWSNDEALQAHDASAHIQVSVQPTHLPNSSIKGDGVRVFLSGRDRP